MTDGIAPVYRVGEKLAALQSTGKVTNEQAFAVLKAKTERRGYGGKGTGENCRALLGWTADGGCPQVVCDGFD